jgi:hypothetical protein
LSSVSSVRVTDTREATGPVSGVPALPTPKGRDPIEPFEWRLLFDIETGGVIDVAIYGRRRGQPASRVRRRILDFQRAPAWVRALIEEWTP